MTSFKERIVVCERKKRHVGKQESVRRQEWRGEALGNVFIVDFTGSNGKSVSKLYHLNISSSRISEIALC